MILKISIKNARYINIKKKLIDEIKRNYNNLLITLIFKNNSQS